MRKKEHLPLLGVGPIINAFQIVLTVIGIILSYRGYFEYTCDLLGVYYNYSETDRRKMAY